MNCKKLISFTLLLSLLLSILAFAEADSSNSMSTYQSIPNNVTFQFPASWGKSVTINYIKQAGNNEEGELGNLIYNTAPKGSNEGEFISVRCGEYSRTEYTTTQSYPNKIKCKSKEDFISNYVEMIMGLMPETKIGDIDVYSFHGATEGEYLKEYAILGAKNYVIIKYDSTVGFNPDSDVIKAFDDIYKNVKFTTQTTQPPTTKPATTPTTSNPKSQTTTKLNVYVNGSKIADSKGMTFKDTDGKVEVPVKTIVEGMGDKYTWSAVSKSATIKLKNGTTIILTDGSTSLKVGGKVYSVVTKIVNGKVVNAGKKLIIKSGVVYVPVSVISSYLKYSVYISGNEIYIGGMGVNTVATNDNKSNIVWVVKNLGFKPNEDGTFAMYNPVNNLFAGTIIGVGFDNVDTVITIHAWTKYGYGTIDNDGKTKKYEVTGFNPLIKKLLIFYLPSKGETLYNMLDNFYANVQKNKSNLNKIFIFDRRKVRFDADYQTGRVFVYIGNNY